MPTDYASIAAEFGGVAVDEPPDYAALASEFGGRAVDYGEIAREFGGVPVETSPLAPTTARTWTQAATDVGASIAKGIGSVMQFPGQVTGLVTGDMDTSNRLNTWRAWYPAYALQGAGKAIEDFGEGAKSPGLKAREQARGEKIKAAGAEGGIMGFAKKAGASIAETVKDPALISSFIAEQAPQLIPAGLAARGAKTVASGISAAVRTGAVQQGADIGSGTYENIYKYLIDNGATPEQAASEAINKARAAGVGAAVISLLVQKLPGAQLLEKGLAGGKQGAGRIAGGVAAAAGETISEIPEELGGQFLSNLAKRQVDPSQSLSEGLGETAGMAALGGAAMGGTVGALTSEPDAVPQNVPQTASQASPTSPVSPQPPAQPTVSTGYTGQISETPRPTPESALAGFTAPDAPLPSQPPPLPTTTGTAHSGVSGVSGPPQAPEPPRASGNGSRPSDGTTIAHADMDARRERLGLPPRVQAEHWTEDGARAEAQSRMQDQDYAASLVAMLESNPGQRIDPPDAVVLGEHIARLEEQFMQRRADLAGLPEGSPDRPAAEAKFAEVENAIKLAIAVDDAAGSSWGGEGRARQIKRARELFESLPQSIISIGAKRGKPLTQAEQDSLAAKFKKSSDAAKAEAEIIAEVERDQQVRRAKEGLDAARAISKTPRAKKRSVLERLAASMGREVTETPPQLIAKRGKARIQPRQKPQLTEQEKAEIDYQTKRTKAVKAAEDAERQAIREEDYDQSASREQGIQYAEANVHPDDVAHPDDIQKNQETRQSEIDRRIEDAGKQAGTEFDLTNKDHPGHPDNIVTDADRRGEGVFMDATGLLTAGRILHTMARQARDLAQFSARAIAKFGNWVKPHLKDLWEAAKRGLSHVHEYLRGVAQAARKTSEQGGTSGHPGISEKDAADGLYHFARLEAQKGKADYADWHDAMQAEAPGRLISKHEFYAAQAAYQIELGKESSRPTKTPAQALADAPQGQPIPQAVVNQLVRYHVEAGETTPEGLLAKVHADLQSVNPSQTTRETAVAISGYGKVSLPDPRPLRKMERELKTLIRLQTALADAQRGVSPEKSGPQRDKAVQRVRAAQQELKDYMRDHPELQPERIATQQATARTALISRLNNRIEDLKAVLAGKQRARLTRNTVEEDDAIRELRGKVKVLKKQVQDMLDKDEAYQLEQDRRYAKELVKRITKQAEAVEEQNRLAKAGDKTAYDKEKREHKLTADEQKKVDDARARKLLADREKAEEMHKISLGNRTGFQVGVDYVKEAIRFFRDVLTAGEFSGLGRQMLYMFGRPGIIKDGTKAMFKAFSSEKRAALIEDSIPKHDNYVLAKRSGLQITDPNSNLARLKEEEHQGRWARNIPFLAGTVRAYSALSNMVRVKAFDARVKEHIAKYGEITAQEAKDIASDVNRATGRSSLGKAENAAEVTNLLLFSAKLLASRFELMTGKGILWNGQLLDPKTLRAELLDPRKWVNKAGAVARQSAMDRARTIAVLTAIYAAVAALQDDDDPAIELDPRSADWLKIRFGNTRIDLLGGLAQMVTFASRLVTGSTKTAQKQVVPIIGPKAFSRDVGDVSGQFLRSKLSPPAGIVSNIVTRRFAVPDASGKYDFTWGRQAREAIPFPMTWPDMYKAVKEAGPVQGPVAAGAALFGAGVNTYPDRPKRR